METFPDPPPAPSRVQNVPTEDRLGMDTVTIPGSFACPPPSRDCELHGGAEGSLLITTLLAQQRACGCNGWDHSYLNELLQTGILEPELIFGPSSKWVNGSYLNLICIRNCPSLMNFQKSSSISSSQKVKSIRFEQP